jgi:hypothetical protein
VETVGVKIREKSFSLKKPRSSNASRVNQMKIKKMQQEHLVSKFESINNKTQVKNKLVTGDIIN